MSILDLFLVSHTILHRSPEIHVLEGISDHKMVRLNVDIKCTKKYKIQESMVPIFTRADDVSILDRLDISFSKFAVLLESRTCSVDDLWLFFKNLVLKCIEDFVPFRAKCVQRTNPWMTKDIVRLGRKTKKMRNIAVARPGILCKNFPTCACT